MDARIVKVIAYIHRYSFLYGFIIALFYPSTYVVGSSLIIYGIWTILGFIFKWTHIFCSYQNAYHKKMTPNNVDWNMVKKIDIYIISSFFIIVGTALFF